MNGKYDNEVVAWREFRWIPKNMCSIPIAFNRMLLTVWSGLESDRKYFLENTPEVGKVITKVFAFILYTMVLYWSAGGISVIYTSSKFGTLQHSIYYIDHVQSVYISDIPPAGSRRFMGIYPLALRPLGNIPINLLCSRWYITYIHLAMVYILLYNVMCY